MDTEIVNDPIPDEDKGKDPETAPQAPAGGKVPAEGSALPQPDEED